MRSAALLDLDLEVFQGPFDLLLTLVLKEEVDLLEVDLADVVVSYIDYLAPVRERYDAIRADEAELERILALGADKARALAGPTLADVRRVMGYGPPPG